MAGAEIGARCSVELHVEPGVSRWFDPMFDGGDDHCALPGLDADIAWRVALEVDVADAAGLHPQFGPHRCAVRCDERIGQCLWSEQRCSPSLDEFSRKVWIVHDSWAQIVGLNEGSRGTIRISFANISMPWR